MRKDWPQLQISDVQVANKDRQSIFVGESLQLSARVHLGGVDPQHVRVEAYHGESPVAGESANFTYKRLCTKRMRIAKIPAKIL